MTSEKAWELWEAVHFHGVTTAREWFPSKPSKYVRTAHGIGNWAANYGTFLAHPEHECYKRIAAIIYAKLPDYGKAFIDSLQ